MSGLRSGDNEAIPRSRVHAWSVCLSRVADRLGGPHGWDPELAVIVREMRAESSEQDTSAVHGQAVSTRPDTGAAVVDSARASTRPVSGSDAEEQPGRAPSRADVTGSLPGEPIDHAAGARGLRPSDTDEDGDPVDWLERARLRDLRPSDADADALRSWRDRVIEAVRDFGREADELWSRVGGKLSGADLQYVAKREALRALVRGASAPRAPVGVRAPNPEAAVPPREEPFYVDGRPIDVDDDDDDARGWTVNGRPVSARDVDHGDAQAEAENPWTVNGAPIPEPKDEHAKCRARLEAEKARVRRAIGLLTDIAKPARVAIGFLDAEEPRG